MLLENYKVIYNCEKSVFFVFAENKLKTVKKQ